MDNIQLIYTSSAMRHKSTWCTLGMAWNEREVARTKVFLQAAKNNLTSCRIKFFILNPPFSLPTAEQQVFLFFHTLKSMSVSINWVFSVISIISWFKIEQRVLELLFLTKDWWKRSTEVGSNEKAGQFTKPFHSIHKSACSHL